MLAPRTRPRRAPARANIHGVVSALTRLTDDQRAHIITTVESDGCLQPLCEAGS